MARALGLVSAWAYSDIDTFASMLGPRGFAGATCASVNVQNDALLVNTTATLIQSADGRVGILCFRGTEPRNIINWLTDMSARMEPFESAGYVHGGFYRAFLPLRRVLRALLAHASDGISLCRGVDEIRRSAVTSCNVKPEPTPPGSTANLCLPLKALYITGHSLGGALAVLAAARLLADASAEHWHRLLKGVYTFGQPMVGDERFAREFDDVLGNRLFRHVYRNDIVPRLPSRTMGHFEHFGRRYGSTDAGWVRDDAPIRQVLTAGLSNLIGLGSFVSQYVFPVRLNLPLSWGDHSPLNYLRTSLMTPSGAEIG